MPIIKVDGKLVLAVSVNGLDIAEFTPQGASDPTEVHIMLEHDDDDMPPIGFRLKSRRICDALIAALTEHRDGVWPAV
jgi:hypothetical protein